MMDQSAWSGHDKAWLDSRKAQWPLVQHSLRLVGETFDIKRGHFKLHKELFLEGTVNGKPLQDLTCGEDGFGYLLHLFWLWYHPEPESIDLDVVRAHYLESGTLRRAATRFFRDWRTAGFEPPQLLSPAYGLMGGREPLLLEFILPGLERRAVYRRPDGSEDEVVVSGRQLFSACLADSTRELCEDARFYPHAPGQLLWEALARAMDEDPANTFLESEGQSPQSRRAFKRLIAEILGFEHRTGDSRRRPTTIAMVERALALASSGRLGETMSGLWREAQAEGDALREDSRERGIFCMSPEDLEGEDELPVKVQQERIAQWRLV